MHIKALFTLILFTTLLPTLAPAESYDPAITPTRTWTCTHATERADGTPFDFGTEGKWIQFEVSGTTVSEPDCLYLMDLTALAEGDHTLLVRTEDTEGRVSVSAERPFTLKTVAAPNPPGGIN